MEVNTQTMDQNQLFNSFTHSSFNIHSSSTKSFIRECYSARDGETKIPVSQNRLKWSPAVTQKPERGDLFAVDPVARLQLSQLTQQVQTGVAPPRSVFNVRRRPQMQTGSVNPQSLHKSSFPIHPSTLHYPKATPNHFYSFFSVHHTFIISRQHTFL